MQSARVLIDGHDILHYASCNRIKCLLSVKVFSRSTGARKTHSFVRKTTHIMMRIATVLMDALASTRKLRCDRVLTFGESLLNTYLCVQKVRAYIRKTH
eukprot:1398246-Pleurochrysis_carterae.AAC.1